MGRSSRDVRCGRCHQFSARSTTCATGSNESSGRLTFSSPTPGESFTPPGPLEDIPEDGWHASVNGNLTATFLTIKSFLPGMKARRSGTIITVSSSAARRAHPRSPIPYAAAKAGIQIMTQHLATQVGEFGVRVNCIAPETILTERNQERIPEAQKQPLAEAHPLRRLGTPDDSRTRRSFLPTDQSAWITGVVLDVAGGRARGNG